MFGVCYYPEHWPEETWADDASAMAELGLKVVRIGEFAWSRLEPEPGQLEFGWLDRAIDTLANAGLDVILGTPTATPPKWLIDRDPQVLPVDPATGRVRGFGSRRHYDFSSETYLAEALRITEAMVQRYAAHPAVVGWQTDNELCCHDTTLSASEQATVSFRHWCRAHYGSIDELNRKWGNVFWSMEYRDFDEIELPVGAVTETSPAHQLAYRRFSSDRVLHFHNEMISTIRAQAADRFITHNFIPMVDTGVDNFGLAANLDFASYDNYPLGRSDLEFASRPAEEFAPYMRTGHPDFAAYYMDQTRGIGSGRMWIMEQQPGPVNWAPNNPRPAPGMIRFWTLEAFAHGAECVSYFRWRQAPFAQEQMHAGLLRPDNSRASGWSEIEQAIGEVTTHAIAAEPNTPAPAAIVTAAEAYWLSDIEKQSAAYDFNTTQLQYYRALRALGIDVDFVSPQTDISGYALVVVPCLPIVEAEFVGRCQDSEATFVFGPRCGAKTADFGLPDSLPPGQLQDVLPLRITSVETLRPDWSEPLYWDDATYRSRVWREELDAGDCDVLATYDGDAPAVVASSRMNYIGTLTDDAFLIDFLRSLAAQCGIATYALDPDIRLRRRGGLTFAFNFSSSDKTVPAGPDAEILLGERTLGGRQVAIWRE